MQTEMMDYPQTTITEKPIRGGLTLPLSLYLAWKDIWRNKGRYLLISMVVMLITVLVLFIAGLTEGLGSGNRELIEFLDADLVMYQANVNLSIPSSSLGWSRKRAVLRVDGVADTGFLGIANATIPLPEEKQFKISLVGVEPGGVTEPVLLEGRPFMSRKADEAIIDKNVAEQLEVNVGDILTIKSNLGPDEKYYDIEVIGITSSRKYFIQPSVFLPDQTWDEVRPQPSRRNANSELAFNLMAVRADGTADFETMQARLENEIKNVEVVDKKTAYENTPGYKEQQSTLNTQKFFTIIIGVLVLGGFFQIQTLQKVVQIGMLKAIGMSSFAIAATSVVQIVLINIFGVLLGCLGTYGLTLLLPPQIPILFQGEAVTSSVIALLLIGPIGGFISVITLLRVEPLKALGLGG